MHRQMRLLAGYSSMTNLRSASVLFACTHVQQLARVELMCAGLAHVSICEFRTVAVDSVPCTPSCLSEPSERF